MLFCLVETELLRGKDTSNTESSLQEHYKVYFNSKER